MNDLTIYNQCAPKMDTGDALLYIHNALTGKVISWWIDTFFKQRPDPTVPTYTHSNMVVRLTEYENKLDRRWILNADSKGVFPILLSRYLENYDGHCWWYPLQYQYGPQRIAIGCYALELAGKSYDFEGLFKNALGAVNADMNRLFCSESVYLAYRDGGHIVTGDKSPRPDLLPFLVGSDNKSIFLSPCVKLF